MTVLLREAIGDRLRYARTNQSRTLRDISRAARVSLGYLSEVERGQKEASSELLASICEALDIPLGEFLGNVAVDVSALDNVELGAVTADDRAAPAEPPVAAEPVDAVDSDLAEFRMSQPAPVSPSLRTTISSPKLSTSVPV